MKYKKGWYMKVSEADKAIFAELAERLQRSQSDALRIVARETVLALRAEETTAPTKGAKQAQA